MRRAIQSGCKPANKRLSLAILSPLQISSCPSPLRLPPCPLSSRTGHRARAGGCFLASRLRSFPLLQNLVRYPPHSLVSSSFHLQQPQSDLEELSTTRHFRTPKDPQTTPFFAPIPPLRSCQFFADLLCTILITFQLRNTARQRF